MVVDYLWITVENLWKEQIKGQVFGISMSSSGHVMAYFVLRSC